MTLFRRDPDIVAGTEETALVLRGNALDLPLADETVDLIVTSPPYFGLRSYRDENGHYEGQVGSEPSMAEFLAALGKATDEMVRVLKPSGSLFVNLGDKYSGGGLTGGGPNSGIQQLRRIPRQQERSPQYGAPPKSLCGTPWRYAIDCIDRLGLVLRAEIIWDKPNPIPESCTDRVRRTHEQWFHFTKQGQYFSDLDKVRRPRRSVKADDPITKGKRQRGRDSLPVDNNSGNKIGGKNWRSTEATESLGKTRWNSDDPYRPDPRGRVPGSVWPVTSKPFVVPDWLRKLARLPDHFAAFPPDFPRDFILGWCPRPGVVLDPFGGTGTTAAAARELGRVGITVDLSSDYCRLAAWRVLGETGNRVYLGTV